MLHDLLTGSDVQARLDDAPTPSDVDDAVRVLVDSGGLPGYLAVDDWPTLRVVGPGHELVLRVAPDYVALGSRDDPYRLSRMTPFGAQSLADTLDSILPSRRLVDLIERASSPKIPFIDVKSHGILLADISTPYAADLASSLAADAYFARGLTPGEQTTFGYKKSIIVAPNLDGSHVAIYGGRYPNGTIVQPYSTLAHSSAYSDYSHGVMLVSRKAILDGSPVDLRTDVFGSSDPSVVSLASDQGKFDPIFPNVGGRSRAMFAASSGGGVGGGGGGPSASKPPAPTTPSTSSSSLVRNGVGLVLIAVGGRYLYERYA